MTIENQKVVSIDYTLTNDAGDVIDKSEQGQFSYLHGSGNIIPGLEAALNEKSIGHTINITIPAAEGYGVKDDSLIQAVTRDMFGEVENIEVGMQFHAEDPSGDNLVITVTEVDGDNVTIDGNHPLAGVNLTFDVSVVAIREASKEEIEHGHPHEEGGQCGH